MSKKQKVEKMFDRIANSYDFLNHFLSLGIDIYWRVKAIELLRKSSRRFGTKKILDVATGTADLAIEGVKLNPQKIIGIDISEKMLKIGKKKISKLGFNNKIKLILADVERIPFENNYFDAVMSGFGVRNFEDLKKGLSEMYRVLDVNGTVVILEFSKPKKFPLNYIFNFYFKNILPIIGKIISKDKEAYAYLPKSVQTFPDGKNFLDIMKTVGFRDLRQVQLAFGIASIYIGKKVRLT